MIYTESRPNNLFALNVEIAKLKKAKYQVIEFTGYYDCYDPLGIGHRIHKI